MFYKKNKIKLIKDIYEKNSKSVFVEYVVSNYKKFTIEEKEVIYRKMLNVTDLNLLDDFINKCFWYDIHDGILVKVNKEIINLIIKYGDEQLFDDLLDPLYGYLSPEEYTEIGYKICDDVRKNFIGSDKESIEKLKVYLKYYWNYLSENFSIKIVELLNDLTERDIDGDDRKNVDLKISDLCCELCNIGVENEKSFLDIMSSVKTPNAIYNFLNHTVEKPENLEKEFKKLENNLLKSRDIEYISLYAIYDNNSLIEKLFKNKYDFLSFISAYASKNSEKSKVITQNDVNFYIKKIIDAKENDDFIDKKNAKVMKKLEKLDLKN